MQLGLMTTTINPKELYGFYGYFKTTKHIHSNRDGVDIVMAQSDLLAFHKRNVHLWNSLKC